MDKQRLENLREKMNTMIMSECTSKNEILKVSREIDKLVVEYEIGQSRCQRRNSDRPKKENGI